MSTINHDNFKHEETYQWMTVKEAALYLKVQHKTIYNWIADGKLKSYTLHGKKKGRIRILREDLNKLVLGEL